MAEPAWWLHVTYDEPALPAFTPMLPDVLGDSPGCKAWTANAADDRPRKRSLRSGVVTRRAGRPSERGPAYPAGSEWGLADAPSRGRRPRAIPAESSSWW